MKIKQIIYILGTTASGKTTQSKKLADLLKCELIEADKVYDHLGIVYDRKDYDQLTKPSEWSQYIDFEEQRLEWWKLMTKDFTEDTTVVIEGATIVHDNELEAIRTCLDAPEVFLYLDPSNWGELYVKKHSMNVYHKARDNYRALIDIFSPQVIKITNLEDVASPLVYQRLGFTDGKWESFGIDTLKKKSLLDLGCNAGWFSNYAKELGATRCVGVDNQWKEIVHARKDGCGDFILGDLNEIIYELDSFDVVIMASALHYFDNKEEIIKQISSLTKEYFVLEIPIQEDKHDLKEYYIEKNDYNIPTKELVIHWLEKYFNKVEVVNQSPPPDGSYRLVFKAYK